MAQNRLLTLLHAGGGLRDAASAAFRAGETVLLRAGLAGVSKQIEIVEVLALPGRGGVVAQVTERGSGCVPKGALVLTLV